MNDEELTNKMEMLGGLMTAFEDEKAAFEEKTKPLTDLIESVKDELRTEFLNRKESFSSDHLSAKYRKGAVRWDSNALKIYAKSHPEMEAFQKVGEPTVAFILVKPDDALMTMEDGA